MTLPPLRALIWFWTGIAGLGATGAAALEAIGPVPKAVPQAMSDPSATTPAAATLPIALPPARSGPPLWPAISGSAPAVGAAAPTASASPSHPASPPPAAPARPVVHGPVRITVIPPLPPDFAAEHHNAHAPGPRIYARLEPHPRHVVAERPPPQNSAVSYSYAESEPAYQSDAPPVGPRMGYGPPPGYGWGWRSPRGYAGGPYYAYYPAY